MVSIENAIGSNNDDVIFGSTGDNWFWTNLGMDTVDCNTGNDTLEYHPVFLQPIWVYLNQTSISIVGSTKVDTVTNCEGVVGT